MSKRLFPILQWLDSNGDVLASGTINTYIEGTTTNKATYSDRTGTANANPIVLDSTGSAQIWMDTDQRYKLLVKNSAGTTIFTLDNISPIAEGLTGTTLAADLDVNGNSIISSSNGDIAITPNGTGDIILDGQKFPQADGSANQVLQTDGAGQISWATVGTGSLDNIVEDTTPQLGGTLDTNAFNIEFDDAKGIFDDSSNEQLIFQKTASAVNHLEITNAATSNNPIISGAGSDANVGISLQPKAGGNIILDVHTWPNSDGTSGQVLQTDGAGTLSFANAASGSVVQQVYTITTTHASTTTTIPNDDTVPSSSEGAQYMSRTITPTSASNILEITATIPIFSVSSDDKIFTLALFVDSETSARQVATQMLDDGSGTGSITLKYIVGASSTSLQTWKLRYGPNSGTAYIGTDSGTGRYGTATQSILHIKELTL